MDSASDLLVAVLPSLLARAPLSPAKVEFAWRASVGPAMARATRVELLPSRTLLVHTDDVNWAHEVERASAAIVARVRTLLGPETVHRLLLTAR